MGAHLFCTPSACWWRWTALLSPHLTPSPHTFTYQHTGLTTSHRSPTSHSGLSLSLRILSPYLQLTAVGSFTSFLILFRHTFPCLGLPCPAVHHFIASLSHNISHLLYDSSYPSLPNYTVHTHSIYVSKLHR